MTDFDAINVVKSNRSLLQRRKFKDVKNLFIKSSGKTVLEFKKVSTEELETIKASIRKQAKKDGQREITIYCLSFLIIAIFLMFFILSYYSSIIKHN